MNANITILYVEDNAENRLLVRRILQAEGYTVLEAADAASALLVGSRQRPDLVLMDINMPEVDGYALTAQLKSLPGWQNVPVVALTANAMKGDRERSLQAGCDGYITKPIDVDGLPRQVQPFLPSQR